MGFLDFLFGKKDNTQLFQALEENAQLIDVRSASEFSSGSAKGAINIPVDKIQAQMSKIKKDRPIIVFCRSGNRSGMAQQILIQNGYSNVFNGGTWSDVNDLVVQSKNQ